MDIAIMLGLGLAAGVLSGLFGIGGGIVLVPMLMLLMKYPQLTANGMSMIALLPPIGLLGAVAYYKDGKISPEQVRLALLLSAGMILGIGLGAKLALGLPPAALRRGFAVFLALVAVKMWMSVEH